jgi:hypothetical protein
VEGVEKNVFAGHDQWIWLRDLHVTLRPVVAGTGVLWVRGNGKHASKKKQS